MYNFFLRLSLLQNPKQCTYFTFWASFSQVCGPLFYSDCIHLHFVVFLCSAMFILSFLHMAVSIFHFVYVHLHTRRIVVAMNLLPFSLDDPIPPINERLKKSGVRLVDQSCCFTLQFQNGPSNVNFYGN